MARKKVIVLSCDWCDTEENVKNRRFEVDGKRRQLEACDPCWPTATITELVETGRQIRAPKRKLVG